MEGKFARIAVKKACNLHDSQEGLLGLDFLTAKHSQWVLNDKSTKLALTLIIVVDKFEELPNGR